MTLVDEMNAQIAKLKPRMKKQYLGNEPMYLPRLSQISSCAALRQVTSRVYLLHVRSV